MPSAVRAGEASAPLPRRPLSCGDGEAISIAASPPLPRRRVSNAPYWVLPDLRSIRPLAPAV